ncbi:MAG: 2-keto-4-pentenoate hydratase [Chromatiales bacterium]|jgi:2-keto-4-pentenoate hydratase|nr:2-keto-4-pentenoate hydratase [Chromatiales bacterium]
MSNIEAAAADILKRLQRGEYFPQAWKGRFDLEDGYRVQLAIRDLRAEAGDPQAGWKVGLTAKAIQAMEGFDEPIFAVLYASGALNSGATLRHADLLVPAFENELCIVLRERLAGPGVTADMARRAIATVAPALEIVEKRGVLSDDPPLAIADNLGQKAFVTGVPVALQPDVQLADATCEVHINGDVVAVGHATAVLDDPANSIAWLANKLAAFGEVIEPGQPVMSGSFTVPNPLRPADQVETIFQPFGSVSLRIEGD